MQAVFTYLSCSLNSRTQDVLKEGIPVKGIKQREQDRRQVSIYEYDEEKVMRMMREAAREDGWEEGLQKGREEGRKQGIKEGIKEGIKKEEIKWIDNNKNRW